MDDYLERLFAEAYRQEVEQEENVVRSLPIIAAIASATLLVPREFGDGVPRFDWCPFAFLEHGLIITIGAAFSLCPRLPVGGPAPAPLRAPR
jgi:hypothetical protein